jgi:hypothetical protein
MGEKPGNYVLEKICSDFDCGIDEPCDVNSRGIFAFSNQDHDSVCIFRNGKDISLRSVKIERAFYNIKISTDGEKVAAAAFNNFETVITIIDINSLITSEIELYETCGIDQIVWSNDDKKIMYVHYPNLFRVIDLDTKKVTKAKAKNLWSFDVCRFIPFFSADDRNIIAIFDECTIGIWSVANGDLIRTQSMSNISNLMPTSNPEKWIMIHMRNLFEISTNGEPMTTNLLAKCEAWIKYKSLSKDDKLFAYTNTNEECIALCDLERKHTTIFSICVDDKPITTTSTLGENYLMTRCFEIANDCKSLFAIDVRHHLLLKIGMIPNWNTKIHKLFPEETKHVIKMMLMMAKSRVTMTVLYNNKRKLHSVFIPREIMLHIFSFLQLNK